MPYSILVYMTFREEPYKIILVSNDGLHIILLYHYLYLLSVITTSNNNFR